MKKEHILRSLFSTLFLILLGLFLILKLFFLDSRMVSSGSMEKTLLQGDYIISWKLHFSDTGPEAKIPAGSGLHRQDILLLQLPGEREILIKRLIGLPGDTVEFLENGIAVNGQPLAEPYAAPLPTPEKAVFYRVPAHSVFVLGDNRPASRDSRVFGFVDITAVRGKVLFCYYPFDRWRWLG